MTSPDGPARSRRSGRARRQVLAALRDLDIPASADDLAAHLPDVHVSSVYRALAVLEEDGVVTHVHLGHGPAIYQLTEQAAEIRHLVCELCGRDVVVPASVFEPLRDELLREYGFVLDARHFAVMGRCTECAETGPAS